MKQYKIDIKKFMPLASQWFVFGYKDKLTLSIIQGYCKVEYPGDYTFVDWYSSDSIDNYVIVEVPYEYDDDNILLTIKYGNYFVKHLEEL